MQPYSYRTIDVPGEGLYKEKGSKFLAFAFPVETEADIKAHLSKLKKKYYDARHHCYAWVLGADKSRYRAFDDGEPNHSAGDPILGQLRGKDLTNILIVVVRYFGGVKLGVGGLVSAYKAATMDVLAHSRIIEREVMTTLNLTYSFGSTPEVMRLLKEFNLEIMTQSFESECRIQVQFPIRLKDSVLSRIQLLQSTGTSILMD